jgi:hypothetical protein
LKASKFKFLFLLENRFFVAAPIALENRPGPTSPVFKPAKYVSDEQLVFEKPVAEHLPFLKAAPGRISPVFKSFRQIQKLLALMG